MTAVAELRGEATRVGQLVHLRAVSRKLAFGDLVVQEGGGTVRLVFKAWIDRCAPAVRLCAVTGVQRPLTQRGPTLPQTSGLTLEDLHYVRCIVKLGDTLRVTGRSEDGTHTCRI
jgi:hypothetical protein